MPVVVTDCHSLYQSKCLVVTYYGHCALKTLLCIYIFFSGRTFFNSPIEIVPDVTHPRFSTVTSSIIERFCTIGER